MQKPQKPTETAPEESQRIAKFLARAGVASRRDAEKLIEAGRIKVNGKILDTPAFKVTSKDKILFDDNLIAGKPPAKMWRYHKPKGLVTSHRDEKGRLTVFDTLPKELGRVISVGRLDLNSEGLLLLTNDGELARQLEHPKTGFSRRYRARAYGRITQDQLDTLQDGIKIDGILTGPIEAMLDSQKGDNCWISVTIREGKNREVRRAMEHLDLRVNRLIRVSYGPFMLDTLDAGETQEIKLKELQTKLGHLADFPDAVPEARPSRDARGRPQRGNSGEAAPTPQGRGRYAKAAPKKTGKPSSGGRRPAGTKAAPKSGKYAPRTHKPTESKQERGARAASSKPNRSNTSRPNTGKPRSGKPHSSGPRTSGPTRSGPRR